MFPRALYMLGFHHESHIPVIHPVMAMSCFRLLALLNKAAVLKVMQTSLQDSSFNCFYLDLEVVVDNIVILLSIVLRTMVPFFFFFFFNNGCTIFHHTGRARGPQVLRITASVFHLLIWRWLPS